MPDDAVTALAQELLEGAKRALTATGSVVPLAVVMSSHGDVCIAIEPQIMNDAREKAAAFREVRETAKERGAHAVVFVADVFIGSSTAEQHERTKLVERTLGPMNVEQRHALGLSTREEAIVVTIHTRLERRLLRQMYERRGRAIVFGAYSESSYAVGETGISGRAVDFLAEEEPHHANP